MLKKEAIELVEKLLKIKTGTLATAISDTNEVDVPIDDKLQVFTAEELTTRDTGMKKDGIKEGKELGYKEVKKAAGLPEDAPSKDPTKLFEAIRDASVVAAKIPVDEKVKEYEKQNQILTQKLADQANELEQEKGKSGQIALDRELLTAFPKDRGDLMDDDEFLTAIKGRYIKLIDGKQVVVGKDGEPIRGEKTAQPVSLAEGLATIFKERNWLAAPGKGGRGGGDDISKPGIFSKKSEVIADFEKQGITMTGQDSQKIVDKLAELQKADPTFDMVN